MVSIRQEVKAYKEKDFKTHNISELDKVSMDQEIFWETFEYEGKNVSYAYIMIGEIRYKVPNSVLKQLRSLDEKYGDKFVFYRVLKTGEGMDTSYLVERL